MGIFTGARIVTESSIIDSGWLQWDGQQITALGAGAPPQPGLDLQGAWVLPGFVDQHCHGGGTGDFFSVQPGDAQRGAATHARRGTTSLIASLVTATTEDLLAQLQVLAPLVADGTFAGVHLEGPWISSLQCGAHDITLLRAPDLAELQQLVAAAGDIIRMVTIAPELPGAMAAIRFFSDHGIVSAVGHTNADYATTRQAIEAGATVATHLLNRMPALDKREPGPVLALVEDPRVTIELIADGVHIHPAVVHHYANVVGAGRVAIVTDAMGAAGAPDGEYVIGKLAVHVRDGVARLDENGALAGSTLTMDRALQVLTRTVGMDIVTASTMLSATPAKAMGLADRGVLAVGKRADLVVLDRDLNVARVMRQGNWLRD